MAYLRIKTNTNKLVFATHAYPVVINATILYISNHFWVNKKRENIFDRNCSWVLSILIKIFIF